jgi:hypothetical protein
MTIVAAAALCGCALNHPGLNGDVFTTEGTARESSVWCSRDAVADMGYDVIWYDRGEDGGLRAERQIGTYGTQTYRGYLTVSVSGDSAARRLIVRAERYAQDTPTPVRGTYPPAIPTGRPNPPLPGQTTRSAPHRVTPGEVAGDARNVVRRCSSDYIREAD